MNQKGLTLVGIGCGGRTRTYCELAARLPHRYRFIAAADPNPVRLDQVRQLSLNPEFRSFATDRELLAAGKLADVCIIGTQDSYHVEPALRAMEAGYDLLLEKPVATHPREVLDLLAQADSLGRKVLVCHVLRYAPFYVKVKEIIESGVLGDILTVDAREGVGPWHQCHSYVRGHWAVTGKATPMLVAKSCHDLDILSWLVGHRCERVSSFGALSHFNAAHAPPGAPARCTDGCPVGETCPYNAMNYAGQHRGWLQWVMDCAATATAEQIRAWLAVSPWGRCVYHCDNDAVDHQVVAMEFAGAVTATFTMTAFDQGRDLIICGTRAKLRGGESLKAQTGDDILVQTVSGDSVAYQVSTNAGGYDGHGGGDLGLVHALDTEFAKPARQMRSSLFASVESHIIGYAAEQSRLTGQTIGLADYRATLR
jgi:predicted dehydrogenase